MPAAAVIPAPIAYIKVVAVKKLVVGSREQAGGPTRVGFTARRLPGFVGLCGSWPRVLFASDGEGLGVRLAVCGLIGRSHLPT